MKKIKQDLSIEDLVEAHPLFLDELPRDFASNTGLMAITALLAEDYEVKCKDEMETPAKLDQPNKEYDAKVSDANLAVPHSRKRQRKESLTDYERTSSAWEMAEVNVRMNYVGVDVRKRKKRDA